MLIQSSFADWKKINNVNKKRSKRKNWYRLCLWDFISKKESFVVHISFYTTRGSFLWRPIKGPLVCSFSPSLHMMTLIPLPLCSSRSHKYSNYDKAKCIVSSNLCLVYSLAPRPQAFHGIPTHRGMLVIIHIS